MFKHQSLRKSWLPWGCSAEIRPPQGRCGSPRSTTAPVGCRTARRYPTVKLPRRWLATSKGMGAPLGFGKPNPKSTRSPTSLSERRRRRRIRGSGRGRRRDTRDGHDDTDGRRVCFGQAPRGWRFAHPATTRTWLLRDTCQVRKALRATRPNVRCTKIGVRTLASRAISHVGTAPLRVPVTAIVIKPGSLVAHRYL
jgi:hypothetical protein